MADHKNEQDRTELHRTTWIIAIAEIEAIMAREQVLRDEISTVITEIEVGE